MLDPSYIYVVALWTHTYSALKLYIYIYMYVCMYVCI